MEKRIKKKCPNGATLPNWIELFLVFLLLALSCRGWSSSHFATSADLISLALIVFEEHFQMCQPLTFYQLSSDFYWRDDVYWLLQCLKQWVGPGNTKAFLSKMKLLLWSIPGMARVLCLFRICYFSVRRKILKLLCYFVAIFHCCRRRKFWRILQFYA